MNKEGFTWINPESGREEPPRQEPMVNRIEYLLKECQKAEEHLIDFLSFGMAPREQENIVYQCDYARELIRHIRKMQIQILDNAGLTIVLRRYGDDLRRTAVQLDIVLQSVQKAWEQVSNRS